MCDKDFQSICDFEDLQVVNRRPVNMQRTLSKHAFFDLSHVSPLVFLYLLTRCYFYGKRKATDKFRVLQDHVILVLANNSHCGPVTFITRCLCMVPICDIVCNGTCHMVVTSLRHFLQMGCHDFEDVLKAKVCASKLIFYVLNGTLTYDPIVLVKLVKALDIKLMNIEAAMHGLSLVNNDKADAAEEIAKQYILNLLPCAPYTPHCVELLIQFSIRQSGESILLSLIECTQGKEAVKWATFMGKPGVCILVQKYLDLNKLEEAFRLIKKINLRQEFPQLYHQRIKSKVKKLAQKGVWDVAEAITDGNMELLDYLVYLSMEAGYFEKAEELCDRYSLKGFLNFKETKANNLQKRYLNLHELFIDEVVWVDNENSLRDTTVYLEHCKIIGLDCEWKPNYEKGSRPNKVSIMQIASEEKVYILDLIKLYNDVPHLLDECLARILHSTSVLKLGYNFQCDIKHLAHSYGDLNSFKHFVMLLDIQNVFKEKKGGLSGLAERILGAGLNKTRRNSNWEQRPLSLYQLEYAALDAAVLLHIFRHGGCHTQPADGNTKMEWKSYLISYIDSSKKQKRKNKLKCGPIRT